MSAGPLLSVSGLSLSFGGVESLNDVSFVVAQGEILAVIGPNGAGKSSVLNVINGFYRPDSGAIAHKGVSRSRMRPTDAARMGIARTFQNIALFKALSARDNIMTGRNIFMRRNILWQALHLGPARREECENREAAQRIIDYLDLAAVGSSPVGQLAYGLQKRVELGRALAAAPDLLLLDEPMAGMNAEEKREMSRVIRDVNVRLGTAIILIEHDMGVVMDLSHRIVVLDRGRKIADGPPSAIQADPRVIDAYLGRTDA